MKMKNFCLSDQPFWPIFNCVGPVSTKLIKIGSSKKNLAKYFKTFYRRFIKVPVHSFTEYICILVCISDMFTASVPECFVFAWNVIMCKVKVIGR